jgi:hypothetical protein
MNKVAVIVATVAAAVPVGVLVSQYAPLFGGFATIGEPWSMARESLIRGHVLVFVAVGLGCSLIWAVRKPKGSPENSKEPVPAPSGSSSIPSAPPPTTRLEQPSAETVALPVRPCPNCAKEIPVGVSRCKHCMMKVVESDAGDDADSFFPEVLGVNRRAALVVGGIAVAGMFALLVWRQAQQTREQASIAAATDHATQLPADPDERSRANILNGSPMELPPGFTLEVAGERSTKLRVRGRLCKTDFFDEIRSSATGRIAKIDGFTTLECVSPDGTISEPL